MTVISDRDLAGKTVLSRYSGGPLLRGRGEQRLWCGHCGEVVLHGVDLRTLDGAGDLVFRCNCGAYNLPPAT